MKRRWNDSRSRPGRKIWLYSLTMIGRSSGPARSTMASATATTPSTIGPVQGCDQLLPRRDVPFRKITGIVVFLIVGVRRDRLGFFGGIRRFAAGNFFRLGA